MRQASMWVGCLALVSSMGCQGSAPAGGGASTVAESSSGTPATWPIVLKQEAGGCSVEPSQLAVVAGDRAIFDASQVSSQTGMVVITPKAPGSPVRFGNSPPWQVNRGGQRDTGSVTGAVGDKFTYTARFVTPGGSGTVCTVDPVICIKGGLDPGQDECN